MLKADLVGKEQTVTSTEDTIAKDLEPKYVGARSPEQITSHHDIDEISHWGITEIGNIGP